MTGHDRDDGKSRDTEQTRNGTLGLNLTTPHSLLLKPILGTDLTTQQMCLCCKQFSSIGLPAKLTKPLF